VRRTEELPFTWRFDDFNAYWRFLNELAGALSTRIAALTDAERQTFRTELEEAVEPYRTERGYELPAVTQNTLAAS
jgi:hypothetical protein